jgi:aminopeptidase N
LTVLFNTPEAPEADQAQPKDPRKQRFTFKQTKRVMSSYLVAFAIGRFDFVETEVHLWKPRFKE